MRLVLGTIIPGLAHHLTIAGIALLLIGACADSVQYTTPNHRPSLAAPTIEAHLLAADVEDRDEGIVIQGRRLGVSFVSIVEVDDFEGAPVTAAEAPGACGASLASLRFEDPSDACWAAFSSAMFRQQFDEATAAVRAGCKKYSRLDYCEFLPEVTETARLHIPREKAGL